MQVFARDFEIQDLGRRHGGGVGAFGVGGDFYSKLAAPHLVFALLDDLFLRPAFR